MNRWLLNIALIAFVAAGFFGVSSVVNIFANSQEGEDHDFSYGRRTADDFWHAAEFEESAAAYKKLADSDDSNCMAHFLYAFSLTKLVEGQLRRIEWDSDEAEVERRLESITPTLDEAVAAFEEAVRFTEFRNICYIKLSALHGLKGQREKALQYAINARDNGSELEGLPKVYRLYRCMDIYYELGIETIQSEE